MTTINQIPPPGRRLLLFRGDVITFVLTVSPAAAGQAFVRTNLGQGHTIRREIIRQVELNEPRLGRDWFDIPMRQTAAERFEAVLGLDEVGHFEAKCLFIPQDAREPLWPSGDNCALNVEPAETCCANSIYNAFVRQFGPYKTARLSGPALVAEPIKALDGAGFTVIPPSGKFRDLIAELDFIIHRLGCRILQLLPIHPTPTTYARMGRFGSPYAALSFTAVDPALAEFDPKATPLDQFLELVDAVHARRAKVVIDIAINHTGWAASLHETHPQWLARNENGEIENPGAWGVVWADLTRLDYDHKDMWTYMADVFLTWCRRGVDGFRCDAGYMIPTPAWQYIIAKVRDQYPDTLFFLEGLGGKISVTRDLLNKANFNWAYSELFQNYDRGQIEWYLSEAFDISATDGVSVHFAETHDNNRLAAASTAYARMRTALCALLAPYGAFAFANGVEWFATEKINVHEAGGLNWGAADNQVEAIARINRILATHPAFGHPVEFSVAAEGEGNFLAYVRRPRQGGRHLLILVNLNVDKPVTACWKLEYSPLGGNQAVDLLTGAPITLSEAQQRQCLDLKPAQVLCLAGPDDPWLQLQDAPAAGQPPEALRQRLRAKVLEVFQVFGRPIPEDLGDALEHLRTDPLDFCRSCNDSSPAARTVAWNFPRDLKRHVMVPPGHFILLRAEHPFRARVREHDRTLITEQSLDDASGKPFVLLKPLDTPALHGLRDVEVTEYAPEGTRHFKGRLLFLTAAGNIRVRTAFDRDDCHRIPLLALGTNGRGAMLRAHADWQRLDSRYDALLAANLNSDFPEDRHVFLSRCRAWVVFQGFSQAVNLDCLERFGFDYRNGAWWRYLIPTGQGEHIALLITARMLPDPANTVQIGALRLSGEAGHQELDDDRPVTFILRPDIEDRNFHHCTKAYTGPEHQWPSKVQSFAKGFIFEPDPARRLTLQINRGSFKAEPEWHYMIHRRVEAGRGLDPDSDLFSPGYFTCSLKGDQNLVLTASATTFGQAAPTVRSKNLFAAAMPGQPRELTLEAAMRSALDQYVVRRGEFRTVIAGYPWFLDWGRDTLIVVRGLIAAGRLQTSRAIVRQFAAFENQGTIPNMIRGQDASNRDTSDAPLWLFTAVADLVAAEGGDVFLETDCGGRTLRQVLIQLAGSLIAGTPNGIRMDPDSGLLFSPAHFTWMDTNYPAATPREGYPVEIQALWHAALNFLAQQDRETPERWRRLAEQVRASIKELFWQPDLGFLADCRHGAPGTSARLSVPDDHLRPNQLLAVTLGAIDDPVIRRSVLDACQCLLVPGAIRSLADRTVRVPLPVSHQGRLLNNPREPYWGAYAGDEDTHRKPAYHNGTAWTWQFPLFCEAWVQTYGPGEAATAMAWLSSSGMLINDHCVGHVPEVLAGDAPHVQGGCDAQAWGVSELLRVWLKIQLQSI